MNTTFKSLLVAMALTASAPTASASSGDSLAQCFPDDIPWYTYEGDDYIFSRMKYNSVCVDSRGDEYAWGKFEGVYPPINEPDSGCSKLCISGDPSYVARGCDSMPSPSKLAGFNYNCDEDACYCLYQKDTLSSSDEPCFYSMDTSLHGHGDVYDTTVEQGSTCYSLHVQPASSPAPPPGSSICVRSPDYNCYQSGSPACCDKDEGSDCPSCMTVCDNQASGTTGTSYCTNGPDYGCYQNGWPSCCDEDNGVNCCQDKPPCDNGFHAIKYLRAE